MNLTPEQLAEMWAWYQERKRQQISFPLDEASKNVVGTFQSSHLGSHTLTQVVTDSNGDTSTVPAAYSGTILLDDGKEIPYL